MDCLLKGFYLNPSAQMKEGDGWPQILGTFEDRVPSNPAQNDSWKFRESVHLIVVFREEIGECYLKHVNDTCMGNRASYDLTTQTLVLI